MRILGLALSIFIFASILAMIFILASFIFRKNYEKANHLLKIIFFHQLFSFAFLTWSLIILNGSFEVVLSTSINYTLFTFFIIVITFILGWLDYILRQHTKSLELRKTEKLARQLLMPATLIVCILNSYLFYLTLHHFYLLDVMK